MWKNIVETERSQMIILHMHFACSIIKTTNTHSEYAILIYFHGNYGNANAHQCYVIRALSVLFLSPRPWEFLPSSCSCWILNLTIRILKLPRNIFPISVCVTWHRCLIQGWWKYFVYRLLLYRIIRNDCRWFNS
jgi:hypothetical protein